MLDSNYQENIFPSIRPYDADTNYYVIDVIPFSDL